MAIDLNGTEQVLYRTDYQFAAGTKVVATGYVMTTGVNPSTSDVLVRIRANSPSGPVVGQCTVTLIGADAVKFAFAGSSSANPVPAVRLFLTVQSSAPTGAEVIGNMDVEVLGA